LGEQDAKIFNVENCRICQQQNNNGFDPNQLQQAQKADLQMNADELKKGTIHYKEYKAIPLAEQENAMAEQNTDSANSALAPPSGVGGLYFYHPDHLGTSTALTDYFGKAYQFFLNLPFGETMAQQLGSNYYNSPYKFNGKELDEETGLYYYGARYYSPRESIWLSVDPLAEKYSSASPYNFVLNNPLRLVDSDGLKADDWVNKDGKQIYNPTANGGKGAYTKYATSKDRKYGDALRNSGSRGATRFEKLVKSEAKVMVNFHEGNDGAKLGYNFGHTDIGIEGNGYHIENSGVILDKATIDIFIGTGQDFINDIKSGCEDKGNASEFQLSDIETIKKGNLSKEDIATGTFGHEIDHLDPNNIKQQLNENKGINKGKDNSELTPQMTKSIILKDISKKDKE